MLQSIRDKTSGLLAYVIVGLISIPFLLWGVQEYLGGGGKTVVAKVNDVDIAYDDLKRATQMQQQRLRQMFGGDVPPALLEGGAMQQNVLNSLIRQELLRQYTEDTGFRVSDAQVLENIKAERAFHVDGKFSEQRFNQLLDSQRMTVAGFEYNVRTDLQKNQFQQSLADSAFVTADAKKQFLALRGQQRQSRYLVLENGKYKDGISISDEQVKEYFDKNNRQFMTEDRVKLAYVQLDVQDLEQSVEVSEDALQNLYEQEKDVYATPESRKAAHILIKAAADASEEQTAAAQEKAKQLFAQIQEGVEFGSLAKDFSGDSLSAANGGDLGFISPGDMDVAFEKELFALNLGDVSQPVKSAQGFHLIKLLEVKEKQLKSFADSRAAIEKEYRSREANRILVEKSEQLLTVSYESPDSLEATADAIGSKIQMSDWVTRDQGTGIGAESKIRAAAFLEAVLNGKNSDVIELADGKQIVVRIAEHEKATVKPLAEVKELIVQRLQNEEAKSMAKKSGEEKLAELKSGGSLEAIAEKLGLELAPAKMIDRNTKDIPAEIVESVFRLNAPEDDKGSVAGLQLQNGDYALIQLSEIKTPEVELTDSTELTASAIMASNNKREFDAAYRAIESRAKLQVIQEALQQ